MVKLNTSLKLLCVLCACVLLAAKYKLLNHRQYPIPEAQTGNPNAHPQMNIQKPKLLTNPQTTVNNWITIVERNKTICKQGSFITMQSIGRIGNNMLEYINLLGFCLTYNCIPLVNDKLLKSLSNYFPHLRMPTFNHVKHCNIKWTKVQLLKDVLSQWKHRDKNRRKNYWLKSFPFKASYYPNYRDVIKNEFVFADEVVAKVDETMKNLMKQYNTDTIVGFHIRRTDMVAYVKRRTGRQPVGPLYYYKAMDYHLQRRPQSIFAIITDDKRWCKKNVIGGDKYRIVYPGKDARFDLAFLTRCNHSISTHGTFGNFGCYLANGDWIRPANFTSIRDKIRKPLK